MKGTIKKELKNQKKYVIITIMLSEEVIT